MAEQLTLMTLAEEILGMIILHTVTYDKPIKPEIWLPGSSKFTHEIPFTTFQWGSTIRDKTLGHLPDAIQGAVGLAATCKKLARIVLGDLLSAIQPNRRAAIGSIIVVYDWCHSPYDEGFKALSLCDGLQSLTLDIMMLEQFFETGVRVPSQTPGLAGLCKLRGIRSLSFRTGIEYGWDFLTSVLKSRHLDITDEAKDELREEIEIFRQWVAARITRPRERLADGNTRPGEIIKDADMEL